MNRPKLYILTGLPYSGKSTLARELMRRFGFSHASVDDEITKGGYDVTNMSQQDWNDVYTRAYEHLARLLQGGKTIIFDGGSLKQRERQNLRSIALEQGAEPVLIYVNTPFEEIAKRRLKNMTTLERAHLKDETITKAKAMFEEPTADEQPIIFNASQGVDWWMKENIKL